MNESLNQNITVLSEAKQHQSINQENDLQKLALMNDDIINEKDRTIEYLSSNINRYNNEINDNIEEAKNLNIQRMSLNCFVSQRKVL